MTKTSSIALLATAAFLSLSSLTAVSYAAEADKAKTPVVDQTTTQSVGTEAPATCDSQGFLSTDCGPLKPGKKLYPDNALQGLNLGF